MESDLERILRTHEEFTGRSIVSRKILSLSESITNNISITRELLKTTSEYISSEVISHNKWKFLTELELKKKFMDVIGVELVTPITTSIYSYEIDRAPYHITVLCYIAKNQDLHFMGREQFGHNVSSRFDETANGLILQTVTGGFSYSYKIDVNSNHYYIEEIVSQDIGEVPIYYYHSKAQVIGHVTVEEVEDFFRIYRGYSSEQFRSLMLYKKLPYLSKYINRIMSSVIIIAVTTVGIVLST